MLLAGVLAVAPTAAADTAASPRQAICHVVDGAAEANRLPAAFLTRILWQESRFRTDVVSPAGAEGVAQFMPQTAAERGLANPYDPGSAIPHAAQLLADMGAEVVKIEEPKRGDPFRGWGERNYAATFCSLNRNKKSVTLDLRADEGREIALKLASNADVLIQNFRPRVMEKRGLGYDDIKKILERYTKPEVKTKQEQPSILRETKSILPCSRILKVEFERKLVTVTVMKSDGEIYQLKIQATEE